MVVKIAVFFDKDHKLATMSNIDKIVIYEKKEKWEVVHLIQEMNLKLNNLSSMRNYIVRIAECLGDCKYVVGAEILGIAYHLLGNYGIEMLEAESFSESLLDQIVEDYILNENTAKGADVGENSVPKEPYSVEEDGKYFLDVTLLNKHHPEISTKKALIPFLDQMNFYELTVVCYHVMPWLDVELPKRGLSYEAENIDGKCKVSIYKKVCES